jgi:farnesyl-diphosphate farnesyltransferase
MTSVALIYELLQQQNRTLGLATRVLPEPIRREVSVACLLFGAMDLLEKDVHGPLSRRLEALARFVTLLDRPPHAANDIEREPLLDHDGPELLRELPAVLYAYRQLQTSARVSIRRHVGRGAEHLSKFVARSGGPHGFEIGTLDDLRDYCYAAAGILGELLTELFVLGRPTLARVAETLETRAADFAEGVYLVGILTSTNPGQLEGRIYLPRLAPVREVIARAEFDLARASTYTEILEAVGTDPGLVEFSSMTTELTAANLAFVRDHGLGATLSDERMRQLVAEAGQRSPRSGFPFHPVSTPERSDERERPSPAKRRRDLRH